MANFKKYKRCVKLSSKFPEALPKLIYEAHDSIVREFDWKLALFHQRTHGNNEVYKGFNRDHHQHHEADTYRTILKRIVRRQDPVVIKRIEFNIHSLECF